MRRTLSLVAATGVALGGVLVPAADAAAPSWKATHTDAKATYSGVAAINGRNVWVVGRSGGNAHAWRFDGRRWTDTRLPAPLQKRSLLLAVAGSASNDVWAFGRGASGEYAIRWNGRAWKVSHVWKTSSDIGGAVVAGPKDVWIHGDPTDGHAFGTWHFNGRSWSRPRTGFTLTAGAAVSARNIWATGNDGRTKGWPYPVVRHWNGKAWSAVKLPALPVAGGHPSELAAVGARSSSDVWAAGTWYTPEPPLYASRPLALHWDGKSWRRFDPPTKSNIVAITPDGKGGAWAATNYEVFHFAKGRWTKASLPMIKGRDLRIDHLSTAPGSTSVWGSGAYTWDGPHTSTGAIIRY